MCSIDAFGSRFFYISRVWGGSGKRTQGVRELGTLKLIIPLLDIKYYYLSNWSYRNCVVCAQMSHPTEWVGIYKDIC